MNAMGDDGKLIEPNRHNRKQAHRHKALDGTQSGFFEVPSAGGILDAALKTGHHKTGHIAVSYTHLDVYKRQRCTRRSGAEAHGFGAWWPPGWPHPEGCSRR